MRRMRGSSCGTGFRRGDRGKGREIPAFAGMTKKDAGMTKRGRHLGENSQGLTVTRVSSCNNRSDP